MRSAGSFLYNSTEAEEDEPPLHLLIGDYGQYYHP